MKEILKQYIASLPAEEYALFLSGGMDSQLILMILLELRKKVHVYTFTRNDRVSHDFAVANKVTSYYRLPNTPVYLGMSNREELIKDIQQIKQLGAKKKTEIECVYPFFKTVSSLKIPAGTTVLTGHYADANFCISKKGMIHYRDRIEEFRDMQYKTKTQYYILKPMFEKYGCHLPMYPYAIPEIREWFRGKSWDDCNKPKQKQIIINELQACGFPFPIEKHSNLQMGDSGIAEGFDILLEGTNFKNPVSIYNRL